MLVFLRVIVLGIGYLSTSLLARGYLCRLEVRVVCHKNGHKDGFLLSLIPKQM